MALIVDIVHSCGSVDKHHLPCFPSRLLVAADRVFCQTLGVLHWEHCGYDVRPVHEGRLEG